MTLIIVYKEFYIFSKRILSFFIKILLLFLLGSNILDVMLNSFVTTEGLSILLNNNYILLKEKIE